MAVTGVPIPSPTSLAVRAHVTKIMAQYGNLPSGLLVTLSHAKGGPWDFALDKDRTRLAFGLRINNDVISSRFKHHKISVHDHMARIAPQPTVNKRAALEVFRVTFPPYRYVPFRKSLGDILNAQTGFLPIGPRVPLERIKQAIRAEARTEEEYEANVRVAEGLYDYVRAKALVARKHEFLPLTLGGGTKLAYWHSLVVSQSGTALIPLFDPRRSSTNLTKLARRFAFSVMHENIRVQNPDFEDARLGIFQFTTPDEGPRAPKLITDEGVELFTFDKLEEMVRETNELWTEVYMQRAERERKRSGTI
jgi:hypothetical protein